MPSSRWRSGRLPLPPSYHAVCLALFVFSVLTERGWSVCAWVGAERELLARCSFGDSRHKI